MKAEFNVNTALEFLSRRNPLDTDQNSYVFALMEVEKLHGEQAIMGLAGFYLYAIREIGGDAASDAIHSTFSHDLSGRHGKGFLPRSIDYSRFWCEDYWYAQKTVEELV